MQLDPYVFSRRWKDDVLTATVRDDGSIDVDMTSFKPGARTQLQVVGDVDFDAQTMGGQRADQIAAKAWTLQSRLGLDLRELKLVGCETAKCTPTGSSIVGRVESEMKEFDLHPEVKGYQKKIYIDGKGRKRPGPRADYVVGSGLLGKPDMPTQEPIASMSLATMHFVGAKPAGGTEGGIFRDESNQHWFVKSAKGNEDFARNEVLAAKLLQMAGVPVPQVRTIDLGDAFGGGVGVASKAIDGARPVNWNNDDAARSAVRRDFAAHAFIGNWDAIGQKGDNYVTDQGGIVYSIDHGGALRYRAQGEPKGPAFNRHVDEIESMRDPLRANEMSAKVFGKVSYDEMRLGVERVVWMSDEGIRLIVEAHGPRDPDVRKELLDTLLARKAHFAAALDAMGPDTSQLGWRRPEAARNTWRAPLAESLVPGVSVVVRQRLANLDRLANADFVDAAGNSKLPLLFRGDDREPGEIFLEGFQPRKRWPQAHADLRSHQIGAGWLHSNLVSTSRGPDTAAAFAINNSDNQGWLYVMHGQEGLDINNRVGENSAFAKELEVVVPDGIAREMIVGAYRVRTGGIVADSFQSNPYFEARFDSTHLLGLRKELSAEHKEALVAWEELTKQGDAAGAQKVAQLITGIEDALVKVANDLDAGARREANRRGFTDIHLEESADAYTRRVVIAEELDPDVMRSADLIRGKHIMNSILVVPDGSTLRTLVGDDDDKHDGPMKISVLSHNRNGLLGGRTPEEVAQHVANAKRQYGGEVEKVALVCCDTAARGKNELRATLDDMRARLGGKSALVDGLESMSQDVGGRDTADDVVKALREHGIGASVTGREGSVYVGFDGSKRAVPAGTEGALGLPNLGTHATDGISPPLRLQDMQRVADKATGSTWPGAVFRDGDGWRWFVKSTGNDEDYARNEILAGRLLVMAGVRVTEARLIDLGDELGGGIGIASRGVPGAQSVDLYKDAAARAAVREHFVAHAFIANWDAVGITGGNYVRDAAGALVSIDHGGALRYRGAGAPKESAFGSTVGELQSMLKKDPLTKHIFSELSLAEVRAGLKRVVGIPDAAILSLVERFGPHDDAARAELGRTLLARKADLRAYQEKLGEPPANLAEVQAAARARAEAYSRGLADEAAAASKVLSALTADERKMLETLHERDNTDFVDQRGAQKTKFDFRGDGRKPSEIFARGFEPWASGPNANADIAAHQKEVDTERSNIVSLSKLPGRATGFANNFGTRTEGHLYVTHGLKGLDLFRRLPVSIKSFEHEIAVPDGVPSQLILGAYDVDQKGIVPGTFQVNPGFETVVDRAGFAARQKTLLGHHALVASSLDDVQDQSWWQREPGLEAELRDHRAKLEWKLEGLYREQKDSARREANRREFTDTTLKE